MGGWIWLKKLMHGNTVISARSMTEKQKMYDRLIVKIPFGRRACPFRRGTGRKGRAARFHLFCRLLSAADVRQKRMFARIPHAGLSHRALFLAMLRAFALVVTLPAVYAQAPISPATADSLIRELAVIEDSDQYYRQQMEAVQQKSGGDSKEMKQVLRSMKQADSLNFVKVSAILERYGWPGAEVIGASANTTLFMVIQHSDLVQQDRYLPVMRKALKERKASASQLALLEDRVALLHHQKQRYGSQVAWDMKPTSTACYPWKIRSMWMSAVKRSACSR